MEGGGAEGGGDRGGGGQGVWGGGTRGEWIQCTVCGGVSMEGMTYTRYAKHSCLNSTSQIHERTLLHTALSQQ